MRVLQALAILGVVRFYNMVRAGVTWKGPEAIELWYQVSARGSVPPRLQFSSPDSSTDSSSQLIDDLWWDCLLFFLYPSKYFILQNVYTFHIIVPEPSLAFPSTLKLENKVRCYIFMLNINNTTLTKATLRI